MKKIGVIASLLLAGCVSYSNDPIVGYWVDEKGCKEKNPYCSFSIKPSASLKKDFVVVFDRARPGFLNKGYITLEKGVYRYHETDTTRGVLMYIENGLLIETHSGIKFKRGVK